MKSSAAFQEAATNTIASNSNTDAKLKARSLIHLRGFVFIVVGA
jgi:hypothetical protein